MMTPEIAIIASFTIFVGLTFIPTKRFFSKLLNDKISQIHKDIEESVKIRKEAELQLAEAIQENDSVDKKCTEILELTNRRIDSLRSAAEKKLSTLEKRRHELIEQAISYQNQIETLKLRHYLLGQVFSEIEKELKSGNCRFIINENQINFSGLINKYTH